MFEPRPVGKPFGGGEFTLALDEHFVDLGERSGSQRGATVGICLVQRLAVFSGAASEHIHGVLEGREIQVRRDRFRGGRYQRPFRIIGGLENAFFDFLVAFTNVILHFL